MGELIIHILIGVIGVFLGIKVGFEYLSSDLYEQNRIGPNEYDYINSWKYFRKCFKFFDVDSE